VKIISGGQTGADRAALDVAIELGIDYGGSIPKDRLAEDGPIDLVKYPCLTELEKGKYLARTRKNVEDADATLAFTIGKLTGGTRKTIEFAKEYEKPYLHINLKRLTDNNVVQSIQEWLNENKPAVLNVAGSKESTRPGIYARVHDVLKAVLRDFTA
jgi:hypothetical protein